MALSGDDTDILHRAITRVLEEEGYGDVRSRALEDYQDPKPVFWAATQQEVVPDLEATKDGVRFLFDIETAETLQNGDSEGPLKLLSAYAEQEGNQLCVVIPAGLEETTAALLDKLHIANAEVIAV